MSEMRWPHDDMGTPVPELPQSDEEWLEAPVADLDAFDALTAGLEPEVELTPELRATYLAVDAVCQAAAMLGATPDMAFQLRDRWPTAPQILQVGATAWLLEMCGDDTVALHEALESWTEGLSYELAKVLGEWCEAHFLPDPVRLWVRLPGVGFTLLSVQYAGIQMNVPTAAVEPDKD